ncbi:hypothetical protein QBC44DRAFT_367995 [Cladorrhinum sp. PSN332]|nr:hypothetical protein QBC44DRAFT_367995 [Cladorrhinum sp. PSN332]
MAHQNGENEDSDWDILDDDSSADEEGAGWDSDSVDSVVLLRPDAPEDTPVTGSDNEPCPAQEVDEKPTKPAAGKTERNGTSRAEPVLSTTAAPPRRSRLPVLAARPTSQITKQPATASKRPPAVLISACTNKSGTTRSPCPGPPAVPLRRETDNLISHQPRTADNLNMSFRARPAASTAPTRAETVLHRSASTTNSSAAAAVQDSDLGTCVNLNCLGSVVEMLAGLGASICEAAKKTGIWLIEGPSSVRSRR